ncbi:MAG TPA: MFS transporter [Kofleriaceae bacterium]|nr:MFS transporter [Kofleriaceae bacterium]
MTEQKPRWAAFWAAWVGWVLDAFDFTIYIVVAQKLIQEFGVSPTAIGGSLTLTLLVRLAGGFCAGWMADRWGRRLPLMMSLVWFAAFDAAIYFAPSFTWIIIFRTLFGFGMGAEWTAGTSLAMESFPAKSRKLASGLLQAGWPVGFLLAAAVAHFVVPTYGWRPMFLIAAVPALLVIPIRLFVPNDHAAPDEQLQTSKGALKDLLEPRVFKMLVLGSLVMALGFIVYYGMVTSHMGIHFEVANCGKDAKCIAATYSHGWNNQMIFNVGMLVGVVLAGWIASRWSVIAALVVPALLMVPALPLFVGSAGNVMWLGAFLGGMLGVGYSGVTPVLTTSLFPAHVRARAIGIVYHVGALLAAFIPTMIPWVVKTAHISLATTVTIVVGAGLVVMSAAVLVLRGYLTTPAVETRLEPSPVAAQPPVTPGHPREMHPVAVAIVDHEVARAAERRALLG